MRRGAMSMTMEQVVAQLQQELFTLRAQVAAESGLADAIRAINNLAAAQVPKDTPSLIDVKSFGRSKESSGEEEDFQQWSKKTEAFFVGVLKESEMMLEWAAEQTVEITTTSLFLSFSLFFSLSLSLFLSRLLYLLLSFSLSLFLSLSRFLTFSLSHFLTFSRSHVLTCSLAHLLTFSRSHVLTFSVSLFLSFSLSHFLTVSLSHCLTF